MTGVKQSGDACEDHNITQHDQFGSRSVMIWRGISLEGRTGLHVIDNSSLTAVRYQDEIIRAIVKPNAVTVVPGFLLVQDNVRPHVVSLCRQFLDDEGIDAID